MRAAVASRPYPGLAIKVEGEPTDAVVTALHFRPHMARVFCVVLEEAPAFSDGVCWCTCGIDSHTSGRHPVGDALDFRAWNILVPPELPREDYLDNRRAILKAWAKRVQDRLGSDYDVVAHTEYAPEQASRDRDHLHVEFDP